MILRRKKHVPWLVIGVFFPPYSSLHLPSKNGYNNITYPFVLEEEKNNSFNSKLFYAQS